MEHSVWHWKRPPGVNWLVTLMIIVSLQVLFQGQNGVFCEPLKPNDESAAAGAGTVSSDHDVRLPESSLTQAKPIRWQLSQETLVLTDDVAVAEAQAARYPNEPEAHFLLAMAYSRTPYFEKAFFAAKKAKKLIKHSPEGYARFDQKISDYEDMLNRDPENTQVLYRLGFAYFMKGYAIEKNYIKDSADQPMTYYQKAEETLRHLIALDPSDIWARNYLGFLLVDMDETKNLDKAIRLWEESLAVNPVSNPGAYFLLGEAYLKKGDLRKALKYGNKGLADRAQNSQ